MPSLLNRIFDGKNMHLYRCLLSDPEADMKNQIGGITKVDVTNIHRYIFEEDLPKALERENFEYWIDMLNTIEQQQIFPPWNTVWLERNAFYDGKLVGTFVDTISKSDANDNQYKLFATLTLHPDCEHMTMMEHYAFSQADKAAAYIGGGYILFDKNHKILHIEPINYLDPVFLCSMLANSHMDRITLEDLKPIFEGKGVIDPDGASVVAENISHSNPELLEEITGRMMCDILPNLYAMMMFHCKNIEVIDGPSPNPKLQKSRKKKKKSPLYEYKVLDIESVQKRYATNANIEGTDPKDIRLQLIPGHFKHYTKEKPLFGKHVGTFWVPSHYRGNVKNGMLEKDYNFKKVESDPISGIPQSASV